MVRKDLEELAAHARGLGLYSTLVTSGLGLTRARAERLRDAGLEHVQISIQDADTEVAERIAGVSSVKQKRAAAAIVKELGFAFSINVVLHRANLDRLGAIIDLAAELGADRLELANTQYYGWALENRAKLMPTRDQVVRAQQVAQEAMTRYRGRMQILFVLPDYFEQYPKPCYGGWGKLYLVVSPDGRVLPVSRGHPDHDAHLRQRAGPLPRVDLARVARVQRLPRGRLDARAVPELPPEDRGLRRLPLPGLRPHRRGREHRSGLHPLARTAG